MTSKNEQFTTFVIPEKSDDFDFLSIIKKYLYHWPLFLVFLLLIAPVAYFYAQTLSPLYEVKASFLIKDDKKNSVSQTSALHEIDLINSAKVIENEIEILKSRKLITQVVNDLNLYVNYQTKDGLKTIDLYDTSPIKINFIKKNSDFADVSFKIKIVDGKSFDLITENKEAKRYLFNTSYKNSFGSWSIKPTVNFDDYTHEPIDIVISDLESVVIDYQKMIDASISNKLSSTIVISLSDSNPKRGKDILNQLLYNYNLASSTDKNKDLKNTVTFLDQKIAELSEDLGTSEKGIENYKSSKGLTDIDLQSRVSLENLQTNDEKLNQATIQLDAIKRIDNYVNSAQNSEKVPSANGITDESLNSLIDKLSNLQLKYQELAATTPETSPEFEPINRQIKTTKQTIRETVRNIKLSLQSTRDKIKSYNSSIENSIRNIPTQEREYVNIKRQQSSKAGLYTYYLQKREEVAANYAATLTDDKIIDQAYAGLPINPKKNIYAISALLLLLLPTGVIYLRSVISNKILKLSEIQSAIDLPVIAEIPIENEGNPIAINAGPSTATSEQLRALRTKLHYIHGEKSKGRVTLVTSSIPGEGKSFVSTNLSISLALTQRKVVLLELDMRKPKITKVFNINKDNLGLSDYFMNKASITSIVQASVIAPNLDIISSGTSIHNPAELLEKSELKVLIEELRKTYDDIIIDSPPVHLVPDAITVSKQADVCLYIVRQGITSKNELTFLQNLIDQDQLRNVSIVFNSINSVKHGYGYKYDNSYYNHKKSNVLHSIFSDFKNRF